MQKIEFKNKNLSKLMTQAIEKFIEDINSFKKKKICIALSGGNSTKKFYLELRNKLKSFKDKELNFFLLDERISTKYRNSTQIKRLLGNQNYSFLKKGNSATLLKNYNQELKKNCNQFDIIIAGVGEDGHIASLFPNLDSLKNKEGKYFIIKNSPKLPLLRISASPKLITNAKISYIFFIGKSKQNAFKKFKNKNIKKIDCPAKLVLKTKLRIITNLK
jgi:6-phosphogluconolactonase